MRFAEAAGFIRRNRWRLALAALIAAAVAVAYTIGLDRYLSLAALHAQLVHLQHAFHRRPMAWTLVYFAVYVAITGLSLPLSVPITLVAGAVFGLWWGSLIVTVAAACGATLSFWAARFLFRDWVQRRFARPLATINRGVAREGVYYLFCCA